jgi:hypothetical protein
VSHAYMNARQGEMRPLPAPRFPQPNKCMTAHAWLKAPQDHIVMVSGRVKGGMKTHTGRMLNWR